MVEYDESEFPISCVAIRGSLSNQELDEMLRRMETWLTKGGRVTIVDLSENRGVEVGHLRTMGRWLNQHRELLDSSGSTTVLVLSNGFLRASASLVFRLAPGAGRYITSVDRASAYREARGVLASASASF